jgi:hypothetical protein
MAADMRVAHDPSREKAPIASRKWAIGENGVALTVPLAFSRTAT